MVKREVNPKEWRELPVNKRLDVLTKLFIIRCTNLQLFSNKGICRDYFRIRNYFRSRPDDEVAKIYDYIFCLKEKTPMDLHDTYNMAEIYRKKVLFEEEQEKLSKVDITHYADITLGDIMNL